MSAKIEGNRVTVLGADGKPVVFVAAPPGIIGRIAGNLAARRAISGFLLAMGEPGVGPLEGLDALRTRYRDALVRHAEADS